MRPAQALLFAVLLVGAVLALMWGRLQFEEPKITLGFEPAQLRLQVVNGDQPVAGVEFRLNRSGIQSRVYELTQHQSFDLKRGAIATSDENGIAHFEHLLPHATYRVVNSPLRGFAANEGELVELRWNQAKVASIQGTLTSAEGSPIEDGRVQLYAGETRAPSLYFPSPYRDEPVANAFTDSQGVFKFDQLGFGEYHVVFEATGNSEHCAMQVPASLTEATPHAAVEIDLLPGVVTRGRVLDADGAAIAGAQVHGILADSHGAIEITANGQGEFELPRIPESMEVELYVWPGGAFPAAPTFFASGTRNIVLSPVLGASLSGMVDVFDGPLYKVSYSSDDTFSESRSDAEFQFENLSPGSYVLLATSKSGELARTQAISLAEGEDIDSVQFYKVKGQRVELHNDSEHALWIMVLEGEQSIYSGYLQANVRTAAVLPVGNFEIEVNRAVRDEDAHKHRMPLKVKASGTTAVKLSDS